MSDASAGFEFIAETAVLQQAVDNMNTIVSECTFEFREDELFLAAVDPANVGMVHQHISAEAFEHYHAADLTIGVNTDRLDDYLGKIQADTVEVTFDTEKRRLDITGQEVSISMAGIDPDTIRERPEQPDATEHMDTHLVTEGGALDHGIDVCRMVSDHVLFQTDPGREVPFHLTGEGDTDDVGVEFDNSVITADYTGESESLINGMYVEEMADVIPTDAEVTVEHGDEYPIFMDWEFADGDAEVSMMVAPRITSQ